MPDDKKLVLNVAHPPGNTCLAFSRDGNNLYTGGADSLVRIWQTDVDEFQEPETVPDAEDIITSLAADGDGWLSGCLDSHVRRYSKRSTDLESMITRAAGVPIRCVATDPKGRRVAVCSDETVVKVIELDDTTRIHLLDEHKKGVRRATWHPSGSMLTTSGADGKIIVWDVTIDEAKLNRVIEGIIPAVNDTESPEYLHDCSALWHPSGHYFVAATKAHEIVTVSRNTWSRVSTFTDDACSGDVTALAFSPNGVYLASACKTGIFIWSTATRRVLFRHETTPAHTINHLAFSPTRNILAWTNTQGELTRWRDVIPPSSPDPIKSLASASTTAMPAPVRRGGSPLLFGADDGDGGGGGMDDDVDVGGERDDDWIIDDIGGGMEEKEKDYGKGGRELVSVTKAQPTFQPGSTPFVNKRRYLAYNNIGVIEVVDQDTHHIVNIEFHDQTTRKNYHFSDHFKYDLAAVGERGIVYACPPESSHPSQITYKPYTSWASQGEWTYDLPASERAIAIAAGGTIPLTSLRQRSADGADVEGNGYVVVATDKGVVRFFSGGGMQRGPVWAVDGDVVAMVAGRDYVFVVHREGGTSLDGNQNLKYTLRTADTFRVMHTGRLPVNKGHTLKWIGISDEGAPVIYDSAERLMMLEHFRFTAQGSWVVLLDATTLARRVGKDESYWPVGVTNSTFMCVILKGREQHPGFPRPLMQELDMKMPYLEMDGAEAQKEERLSREAILLDQIRDTLDEDTLTNKDISKTEVDLDKELIQLIQLACKHDKLQRALDAVKLLHHTASFDMAVKVAQFYHLAGLQEKIEWVKGGRVDGDRLRDERERRKGWKRSAGVVTPNDEYYGADGRQNAAKPFQNVQPAPAIRRPGLAPAIPSADPSPFSRKASATGYGYGGAKAVSTSPEPDTIPSPGEGKRKRGGGGGAVNGEDEQDSMVDSSAKRRATDENVGFGAPAKATPPAKANPFAKKRDENANGLNTSANPFQRKVDSQKSMHKSDSFFNKVEAAEKESEKGTRKGKAKVATGKQTTLFNLPAAPAKRASKSSKDDRTSPTPAKPQDPSVENSTEGETQESDATMMEGTSQTLAESQQETQLVEEPETQLAEASGDMEVNNDEPIEWPASPPPMNDVVAVGAE